MLAGFESQPEVNSFTSIPTHFWSWKVRPPGLASFQREISVSHQPRGAEDLARGSVFPPMCCCSSPRVQGPVGQGKEGNHSLCQDELSTSVPGIGTGLVKLSTWFSGSCRRHKLANSPSDHSILFPLPGRGYK